MLIVVCRCIRHSLHHWKPWFHLTCHWNIQFRNLLSFLSTLKSAFQHFHARCLAFPENDLPCWLHGQYPAVYRLPGTLNCQWVRDMGNLMYPIQWTHAIVGLRHSGCRHHSSFPSRNASIPFVHRSFDAQKFGRRLFDRSPIRENIRRPFALFRISRWDMPTLPQFLFIFTDDEAIVHMDRENGQFWIFSTHKHARVIYARFESEKLDESTELLIPTLTCLF